ncbi:MAG: ankyrin repeat domain-containing protein [Nostoc sp.]
MGQPIEKSKRYSRVVLRFRLGIIESNTLNTIILMRFFLVPAYISILLVTLLAGCSSPQKVQLTVKSPISSPNAESSPPLNNSKISSESPKNTFQDAVDAAVSATTISQSSVSKDDWNLVYSKWQEAINLMRTIPDNSENYVMAQKKIAEYSKNLSYAKQQATKTEIITEEKVLILIPPVSRETCREKEIIESLFKDVEKDPQMINEPIPKYAPGAWGSPFPLLHTAVGFGCKVYVELLISMNADVNNVSSEGLRPLDFAYRKDIAALLIAKGANINATNDKGLTALHYKAQTNTKEGKAHIYLKDILETSEFLISKGANINAKDRNGKTPLAYAKSINFQEMIRLLKSYGGQE